MQQILGKNFTRAIVSIGPFQKFEEVEVIKDESYHDKNDKFCSDVRIEIGYVPSDGGDFIFVVGNYVPLSKISKV